MEPVISPTSKPYSPPDLLLDATQSPLSSRLSREVEGNVGYVASMGATGILYLPGAFCEAVNNLISSIRNFDGEGAIEASLRMLDIPFGLAYALQRITAFLLLLLKGVAIFALNVATYAVGIIFVFFELILESHRLYNLMKFRNELKLDRTLFLIEMLKSGDMTTLQTHRSELEKNLNVPYVEAQMGRINPKRPTKIFSEGMIVSLLYRKLSHIHSTYFRHESVDGLRGQLNSLARRIRPWLVRELQRELPTLLNDLQNLDDEAIRRSTELLEAIDTQTTKARNMYIVGLVALSVALILFGLSFVLAPYLTPLLLVAGLVGTAMEFGRWFAPKSYLDQKDSHWNWNPWLPNCLKSKREHQTNSREPMIELRELGNRV